ncbi:Ig-like domain-containing protein [Epilithonimonas ginsengisoli]|uniref:Ig-like domain-containing protein n=1 Tax=Epilithonimonas ginsengisoli TaxID=1245592 RepID=A0ABU4JIW4_9FLAO|nr:MULTISPECIES: Ig-like domain-containing protein [Chryseobacterium group]MBV6880815.1 T9SS type A sorting domain-containing protein [Epilithonimonas sp. FP105]MDW8549615.1 Ig-like domain-containing protein [Epilithonimonas ginsengisoli]OAH76744.1 hypothetical protein AXA65_00220 [Chryseobacterium sp. FP211-J200]
MKKNFYFLFAIFIANIFSAQSDLVTWGLTSNGGVKYSDSRIVATPITTSENPISYDAQGMKVTGWNNGNVEHYRYFGFSVGSSDGNPVNLSNLAFEQESLNASVKNYTVRYYIAPDGNNVDDWNFFYSVNAPILVNNESISSNSVKNIPLNVTISGTKRLIVRFYTSGNDWGAGWRIKVNSLKITNAQQVAPVANNDTFTAYKNIETDLDIFANDVPSTNLSSVTVTQQPSHGTLTINGMTNVTYKPTTGYTGSDSFKYKTSNAVGISNEATANINVVESVNAPLVRWNNSNYQPTAYNSYITVGDVTSTANLSYTENVSVNGVSYNAFQTTGWPDKNAQTIDTSKYVQFTISPKVGYKLNLSEFNFLCAMQGGDANIRIDYSLKPDFSDPVTILPQTTINGNLSTISLTNFSKPIATDGQVVFLRVYVYNTWNAMQILLRNGQSVGPIFNGTVEYSSTVPLAYNDTITNIVNNDIDINVLVNDDYSNKITSLTYTQPAHGTTLINADRTINYIPAKDYVGSDSFTYYITNQYGVSNVAMVNITNNVNSTSPLVRWDKTDFTPTTFQSFIGSTPVTTKGGLNIKVGGETNPRTYYVETNGNNTTFNSSRYVQFVLDNTSTKKTVEPKTFTYVAKGTAGAKYEIRYSKDANFSNEVVLSSGLVPTDYTLQSFNFDEGLKLEPGEKVYIRLFLYNSFYVQFVMQFITGGMGPQTDGLYYNSVYSPNSTIWLNPTNPHWSNGIPTATKNAIVDTNYNTSVYGNFESKDLTINAGASITINAGGSVTVKGQVINNANAADFTIENEGNLLQTSNSPNTGKITVKKSAVIPKMGYNYWSSPVSGQNLYQFSEGYNQATTTGTGTPWNRFYVYNESNDYFVTSIANEITVNSTSVFQPARGYAIRGKNSFPDKITSTSPASVFEFVGTPQNGDFSYTLKYTNAAHGYNMVGNPYPSNLSFDDLFAVNSTKINGVAYCWTNNDGQVIAQQSSNYKGNNYAIYNGSGGVSATYYGSNNRKPTGVVSVGQGFIVLAKAAGKNQPLIFNNTMRSGEKANFYNKSNKKDRFWLELKSPTDANNEILLGYIENATNNFETNFDTELLAVGNDSFWSILDTKKLGIQARQAPLYNDDVIKLGFKASVSGNYTITITDKEGVFSESQTVYLKDRYLNKVTNISTESYVFATNEGQYEDRFEIIYRFTETLGTDNSVKKGIEIYKDTQNFIVRSDENLENISVYDAVGRLIFNIKNAKKEVLINKTDLSEGMYIIKANSRNTTMTKKVLK